MGSVRGSLTSMMCILYLLVRMFVSLQAGIMRERQLRQDLRRQMDEAKEEMKGRVSGG